MSRPITSLLLTSLLILSAATAVLAQYSEDAFTLKKAGELYDERGFYQNKAITVDGKLVVSNSNGNVSYSYPISSWQVDGYPFSTSLNYCGSAAFQTHGEYDPGDEIDPHIAWTRFSQNRPVWLLGVNGFAVQSLSFTTAFHADPSWQTNLYENESVMTFQDDDFVWTLDGYDICNRMQNFSTGDYTENGQYIYRDVIRLLRDDGSILELLNKNDAAEGNVGISDVWNVSQHLYSGYYVVNEANHKGYAWVEFTTDGQLFPWWLDAVAPDAPRYTPRKVHYYPGDGLEYIFLERFNPYGMHDIRDALGRYGSILANPTIFYLSEIRSAGRTLAGFTYSRHGVQHRNTGEVIWDMRSDSSCGRALLLNFDNHTLTYGDGWIMISAFNRVTTIKADTVAYSGNANPTQHFPLATLGYANGWSDALSKLPLTNGAQFKSWSGYVTSISDPEGRTTTFDYEQYERRHWEYGWPRAGADIGVWLKNYRLSAIVEPTAKYAITYHNRGSGVTMDVDGLDTLSVYSGSEGSYPYAFSNSARKVEKRTLAGTLLSTDRYDCTFTSVPDGPATSPSTCTVVTKDAVTGFSDSTIYSYSRIKLPRSIPKSPDRYFTQLDQIDHFALDATGGVIQTTGTENIYDDIAPYLLLPVDAVTGVDGSVKTRKRFHYDLDTVRRYGDDDTLIKYHGMEVRRQVEVTRDPLFNDHLIDTTLFLNIPEFDSTFTHIDSALDWKSMRRRYDSLRYQVGDSLAKRVDFSQMLDDPRVLKKKLDTIVIGQYKLPPIFGLVSETWTSDTDSNYLGGRQSTYCLFNDCDAGPASTAWVDRTFLLGAKISDTIIGRGRDREVSGGKVVYDDPNRGLPNYMENRFGARTRFHYGQPGGSEGMALDSGAVLANDDVTRERTILSTSYLSRSFGVPQIERAEVRRYTPGGSLIKDTLKTSRELTYYGLASAVVDPNGWVSEFDYDANGRLNTAWLPYDFQSTDSLHHFDVFDTVVSVGYGGSMWQIDTIDYYCSDTSATFHLGTSYHLGPLLVNKPINRIQICGGGHYYDSTSAGEKGAEIQDLGSHVHYTVRKPAVAGPNFTIQTPEVRELLSLDSAVVELTVSSVTGSCVTLNVTIPAYTTFQKTYVLNCTELDPGLGDDTLGGLEPIRIPLGNYVDSIADDQYLSLRLETTTSGGEIRFVNAYDAEGKDGRKPRLLLYGEFREFRRDADYTLKFAYDDDNLKSEEWAKVDDSAHTANNGIGGSAMAGLSRTTKSDYSFGADYRLQKGRVFIGNPGSPTRIDSTLATHTGLGAVLKATDQVGDTVSTLYDAVGRPVKTYNQDGTYSTIAYYTCGYDPDELPDPEICDSTCYEPSPPWWCDCPVNSCFGIDPGDQDFYGFILAKVTTNENGTKFAQYFDAFDRLRREIADSGGLHRVTKYEYDLLGRTKMVVNPGFDTILYWYDDFGRVQYKGQPDLGTISYAYDDLGNVRFVQTQEQHLEDRLTFNQYDDLNRLVIVGEADFEDPEEEGSSLGQGEGAIVRNGDDAMVRQGDIPSLGGVAPSEARRRGGLEVEPKKSVGVVFAEGGRGGLEVEPEKSVGAVFAEGGRGGLEVEPEKSIGAVSAEGGRGGFASDPEKSATLLDVPTDEESDLGRLTDELDPNHLHDSGKSAVLTANKTLWMSPSMYGNTIPGFWALNAMDTVSRSCSTMNALRPDAVGPFLRHAATTYNPTSTISTEEEFENLAKYPENVRIAISYDRLPEIAGPVWGNFPLDTLWDDLAPRGSIRNLKGHEAAVAYREHGGEPYHYSVMSYDERGRVEALLRYTENLGFDAVYYKYNSLNQVIRLMVADPLRRYTTWYGYDRNGRVDSVWTKLDTVGSGLWNPGSGAWAYPSGTPTHSSTPNIRYVYTKTGQVDSMYYPPINTRTAYKYGKRKWLDTLIAVKGSNNPVFKQYLTFDPTGQIIKQVSQQGTSTALPQNYFYDDLGQLIKWTKDSGSGSEASEVYVYDSVGNRTALTWKNHLGQTTSWRTHDIGRRVSNTSGPNQLLGIQNRAAPLGTVLTSNTYEYDDDGALKRRKQYTGTSTLVIDETFSYSSWRGLSWEYSRTDPNLMSGSDTWKWRYRYNAMGEREQKREVLNPGTDSTASNGYGWTYFVLDGNRQQLSVWNGLQTSDAAFCSLPGGGGSYTHLYPSEYMSYGSSTPNVVTKPTSTTPTQEYRIADHLGSNRVAIGAGGTILSTTDYEPFGQPLPGSVESRKSFIDKEKDAESQLGNFGVRVYDNDIGRFASIDPLFDKYANRTPYQYAANSPVAIVDPSGLVLDFTDFINQDKESNGGEMKFTPQLLDDLSKKTGLRLWLDETTNDLKYEIDKNAACYSPTAREWLMNAIDDPLVVNVVIQTKGSKSGAGSLGLDPNQILSFIDGAANGLDPTALGWAITFLHEGQHTMLHSPDVAVRHHRTENTLGEAEPGGVVEWENRVRNELGMDLRKGYGYIQVGNFYVLPFSDKALYYLVSHPERSIDKIPGPFLLWPVTSGGAN